MDYALRRRLPEGVIVKGRRGLMHFLYVRQTVSCNSGVGFTLLSLQLSAEAVGASSWSGICSRRQRWGCPSAEGCEELTSGMDELSSPQQLHQHQLWWMCCRRVGNGHS